MIVMVLVSDAKIVILRDVVNRWVLKNGELWRGERGRDAGVPVERNKTYVFICICSLFLLSLLMVKSFVLML